MAVIEIKQDRKNHYIKTPKILNLNQRTTGMKSHAKIITIILTLLVLDPMIILKIIMNSTPSIRILKIIAKVCKTFLILMNGKMRKTILTRFPLTKKRKKLR